MLSYAQPVVFTNVTAQAPVITSTFLWSEKVKVEGKHVISLQGSMLDVSQNSSVYIPLARRHNHVITSVMLTSVFILDGSVPAKNGGCCYQERREYISRGK